ncbi:MAG: cytochrome c oxidase subunit I [Bryobacteraceae bacterium]|jgi:cytochrome c oxidase subunit 1
MADALSTTATGHSDHLHGDYLDDPPGLRSWLTTVDHKRIGLMYLWSVTFFMIVGGLFAMLIRLEHLTPGRTIMSAEQYNRVFTLHGAIMVFLVIIPAIPAALGNFALPLLLGARDVAFPRINLMSLYLYWTGALMALGTLFMGGVDTGWTFYTPYSTTTGGGVTLMVLAAFVLGFSSIFTGVNFIATVHKLRAPGMGWFDMPLFCWGMYSTALIQILATPVLGITLLLLVMERVFHIGIFDPQLGGDPVLFQHFFWFYSHPAVYIMILPAMAVMSEVIPTFSHKTIFGYKAIAFSSVAIALLGFLVWAHHMFVAGMSTYAGAIFSFLTFFIAIPSAIKVFNWIATMWQGSIELRTPMLYAIAFLLLFTIGGLTGLFLASLATDVHLHDTYFVVAHFHFVMAGSNLFGLLAGLHYWWPKMYGRLYNETLASLGCVLTFIGFNATFLPQFVLGSRGMPRRYFNYLPQFQALHVASTIGSWILAAGLFLALATLLASLRRPKGMVDNPWGGKTLEWMTSSPPPTHNFEGQPLPQHGPYDYRPVPVPLGVERHEG